MFGKNKAVAAPEPGEQSKATFPSPGFRERLTELCAKEKQKTVELAQLQAKLAAVRANPSAVLAVGGDPGKALREAEAAVSRCQGEISGAISDLRHAVSEERKRFPQLVQQIHQRTYADYISPIQEALDASAVLQERAELEALPFEDEVKQFNSIVEEFGLPNEKIPLDSTPLSLLKRRPRVREFLERFKKSQ